MRELIKQFVKIISETLPIQEPIYEFGSLQVPGQEGFADLRPFFKHRAYVGCDIRNGTGVDKILNIHNVELASETAGMVMMLDTLEHVKNPHQAMSETYRILQPGGFAIISSVMDFPIHEYPHDYWRFTPDAFRILLEPFCESIVDYIGASHFPHTIVGIGRKDSGIHSKRLLYQLSHWKKRFSEPKHLTRLKRVCPPLMWDYLSKFRRRW